jgi:hypothetical protein
MVNMSLLFVACGLEFLALFAMARRSWGELVDACPRAMFERGGIHRAARDL